jgi:acetyl-CoA carboxylase biotin carboxyl carrier protein
MSEDRPDTEKDKPMDLMDKIRQLAAIMEEVELAELEVEEPELRLKLRTAAAAFSQAVPQVGGAVPAGAEPLEEDEESPSDRDEGLLEITSPMVGTFYRAPSEGAEPYVTVGTIVEPEAVVCIVEAMKVMNEVKAEVSGEIVEILAQNGEPVEFGQVLFLAKPLEE